MPILSMFHPARHLQRAQACMKFIGLDSLGLLPLHSNLMSQVEPLSHV